MNLPDDVLYEIMIQADKDSLELLCFTNQYSKNLCNNQIF